MSSLNQCIVFFCNWKSHRDLDDIDMNISYINRISYLRAPDNDFNIKFYYLEGVVIKFPLSTVALTPGTFSLRGFTHVLSL